MELERLAEYRGYVASGRFSNVSMGVFAEVMAYVDELEASRERLREYILADEALGCAQLTAAQRPDRLGLADAAQHAEDRLRLASVALQPGDLGEESCEPSS